MEEKILETNTVENKKENQTKFSKKKGIFLALILITVICIGIIGGSFLVPKTVKGQWELIINPEISQSEDQKEENKKPSLTVVWKKANTRYPSKMVKKKSIWELNILNIR